MRSNDRLQQRTRSAILNARANERADRSCCGSGRAGAYPETVVRQAAEQAYRPRGRTTGTTRWPAPPSIGGSTLDHCCGHILAIRLASAVDSRVETPGLWHVRHSKIDIGLVTDLDSVRSESCHKAVTAIERSRRTAE